MEIASSKNKLFCWFLMKDFSIFVLWNKYQYEKNYVNKRSILMKIAFFLKMENMHEKKEAED